MVIKIYIFIFHNFQIKAAYGDDNITGERVLKAISQFMRTMISADSKYDRHKKGTASFTSEESQGMALFQNKKWMPIRIRNFKTGSADPDPDPDPKKIGPDPQH